MPVQKSTVYAIYSTYKYFRNFGLGGETREGLISQFSENKTTAK